MASPASQRRKDPTGAFGDFVPWIIYWVLIGNTGFGIALGSAFAVALALSAIGWWTEHHVHVLRIGGVVVFPILALLAVVLGESFVEQWIQPLGNTGLALVVIGGLVVGRPFTMDYARDSVSPEMAASPGFLYINVVFTRIWAVAFVVAAAVSFIPPIVEGNATIYEGGSPLSILCYWVIPFLAIGMAAVINVAMVKRLGAVDSDQQDAQGTGLLAATSAAGRAAGIAIQAPDTSSAMTSPHIVLTGLQPDEPAEISVQLVDALNRRFVSTAAFVSDGPDLDVGAAAPTDGTWSGADPDGPIWSAQWDEATPAEIFLRGWMPQRMLITARQGDRRVHREVSRVTMADGVSVREVHSDEVVGRAFVPADEPRAALVLVGGSEGGFDSLSSDAAQLAGAGVAALVVGLFGAPGLPENLDRVPLEPIQAAREWLAALGVPPARIALFGLSRGAEAVLSAAARFDSLHSSAVVAAAPSSVVWGAEVDGVATGSSSWTVGGVDVPFMPMDDIAVSKDLIREASRGLFSHAPTMLHVRAAYEGALPHVDPAAVIPVERITGRVSLVAGKDDGVWPSDLMAVAIGERRPQGSTDVVVVPGAGHLITTPLAPCTSNSVGGLYLGGQGFGNHAAQVELARALQTALGAPIG